MKSRKLIATGIVFALISVIGIILVLRDKTSSFMVTDLTYRYDIEVAFPNLMFDKPVGIYNAGDGRNRLFVVEQEGVIRVFENSKNTTSSNVFLDIIDRVLFGGEKGLLGLTFHPDFANNGYFYVDYTTDNPRRTVIARYSVSSANSNAANSTSEVIILEVEQPYANHNGGQIAFGPDNYLYIALGDGGSGGDPLGNGQNPSTLLGSILRIDVDSSSDDKNYSIPSDNPFIGNNEGYQEEIFAYGLRNPWRFSFDPFTEWLWAADVGQNRREEVDIVEKGRNYGWNTMEGSLCYSPPSGCNQTGLELPIWEYDHSLGNSITGGFVYLGAELTELRSAYVYGDWGSGRIWAIWYNGSGDPVNKEIVDTAINIPSFGVDETNELYICSYAGEIYKLKVVDDTPPKIGSPLHTPQDPTPDKQVRVNVNATDEISGIREVILSYGNDTNWVNMSMTWIGGDTYTANITEMPYQTNVRYKIIAYDNSNNSAVNDNDENFYTYIVISEFSSVAIIMVFFVATFVAAVHAPFSRGRAHQTKSKNLNTPSEGGRL